MKIKAVSGSLLITLIFAFTSIGCKHKTDESEKRGNNPFVVQKEDTEFFADGAGFKMKTIPAASEIFLGDESTDDNKPYKVSLDSFQIGETEVTQELWLAVMGENPAVFKDSPAGGEVQEKRPAEGVSWYDCIVFCNELTKKLNDGKSGKCVYYSDEKFSVPYTKADAAALNDPYQNFNKKGFRLPTEAEWAWAAMGGSTNRFAGTDDKNLLKEYAWFSDEDGGDSESKTHEVKKKKANGFGLYDMCGNVREWCWNRYTEIPEAGRNPVGGEEGGLRIASGGSWFFNAAYCAIIYRGASDPAEYDNINGLRLARSL